MTTLRRIQLTELEILNEVVRICDEHSLNYFFVEGTLLGAMRHHGFIPWDDDIDIGMPREDYDRFLAICEENLGERFVLQWYETDEKYWLPFAKVRLKNTIYTEHRASENLKEKGFWIDIFPFDHSGDLVKRATRSKGKHLKRLFSLSVFLGRGGTFLQRCFVLPLKILHIKCRDILRRYDKIAKKGAGDYIVNYGSAYEFKRQTMPRDWYFPPRKEYFEGKLYNVPNCAEKVLTQIYGNYMQLPPKSERTPRHAALNIRFADGSTAKDLQD